MPVSKKTPLAVSVVITTYGESQTIAQLLHALEKQSYKPTEIIVVDACSPDGTTKILRAFARNSRVRIRHFSHAGNRSVGRNLAIRKATSALIASTDAGCIPDVDWLQELVSKYRQTKAPVIAGYYRGMAQTRFEEAVIPYALVMPDKVREDSFLPATRSMLLKKKVWQQMDGFDESLSDNEDYAFARLLKSRQIPIAFAQQAIVSWHPRSTFPEFFVMLFRFARGDIQARLFRIKVVFIFARYTLLLVLSFFIAYFLVPIAIIRLWVPLGVLYSLWAVDKNVRYTPRSWFWLPILQVTADVAVMSGSLVGLCIRMKKISAQD